MERKYLPVRIQSRGSCLPRIAAFLLTALLSCISTVTFADDCDFTAVNDDKVTIYYNYINDKKEAEVTSVSSGSYSGTVNIPATVTPDGTTINVTSIGDRAFLLCSSLTSVTIPNSVTNIGEGAFTECSSLKSVTIPNSVTNIGEGAFSACSILKSVTISNSVTNISKNAFQNCSSLTSITIPNSVTSICDYAFDHCTSLPSIVIPSSVKSICERAFSHCTSLTSIVIPSSVTSIRERAFSNCTSLDTVTLQGTTLPECVTNAFDDISSGAKLYCKTELVESCKNKDSWKVFKKIRTTDFFVTIPDAGIASACFDKDLDFSEMTDLKVYIASGFSPSAGKVLLTRAMQIPANTGFIVSGKAGTTYEIPMSETDYTYANLLVGTSDDITLPKKGETTYTYYVLGKDTEGKAGFLLAKDNCEIPVYKAYLQIPTSAVTSTSSNVKKSLSIGFDDEDGTITGVAPVKTVEEETNGNTVIYNINGQRMQSLTRGLNIVNGKKIFIK